MYSSNGLQQKDENGKPIKTAEKNLMRLKQKGRTVYDGGGVLPDVVVNEMKKKRSRTKLNGFGCDF